MADDETTIRRPVPALLGLLALAVLTGLVWWRVLHRDTGHPVSVVPPCRPQPSATVSTVFPAPASVPVSVLNSTPRPGIAKSGAAALAADGFNVTGYGNDTGHPPIPGAAEIRFAPAQRSAATLLGYYLPGATLVPQADSTDATVVVSLGLKFAAVSSPATAQAALAAAHATVSPGPSSPAAPPAPASRGPGTAHAGC